MCDTPQFEDDRFDTLLNPTIVIEVLSPSTESYDRGKKFLHYRSIPSLREYVLVSQDRALLERFHRDEAGEWRYRDFADPDGDFELFAAPMRIPMTEIYRWVDFDRKARS